MVHAIKHALQDTDFQKLQKVVKVLVKSVNVKMIWLKTFKENALRYVHLLLIKTLLLKNVKLV
jgi:hypothetical protein